MWQYRNTLSFLLLSFLLLTACSSGGGSGIPGLLPDATTSNNINPFYNLFDPHADINLNKTVNRLLVTNATAKEILAVHLDSGESVIFRNDLTEIAGNILEIGKKAQG